MHKINLRAQKQKRSALVHRERKGESNMESVLVRSLVSCGEVSSCELQANAQVW